MRSRRSSHDLSHSNLFEHRTVPYFPEWRGSLQQPGFAPSICSNCSAPSALDRWGQRCGQGLSRMMYGLLLRGRVAVRLSSGVCSVRTIATLRPFQTRRRFANSRWLLRHLAGRVVRLHQGAGSRVRKWRFPPSSETTRRRSSQTRTDTGRVSPSIITVRRPLVWSSRSNRPLPLRNPSF
jgi:hypothetical protein